MSEYFTNKIDFIIMIVLALLVAFIIGFNILQLIDSKSLFIQNNHSKCLPNELKDPSNIR